MARLVAENWEIETISSEKVEDYQIWLGLLDKQQRSLS